MDHRAAPQLQVVKTTGPDPLPDLWRRAARMYDWQLALERRALVAAVDLLAPRRDDALLDLGTGTGGLLRELSHRPQRPDLVTGLDSSAAMLAQAPALPAGWTLQQADARRLPFEDGQFTAVTAAYLLHVVAPADRRAMIAQCRRVLRPDGRLVLVTPAWPRTRVGRILYAPLAAAATGHVAGPARGLAPYDPRPELARGGFEITAAVHIGRGYPSICTSANPIP